MAVGGEPKWGAFSQCRKVGRFAELLGLKMGERPRSLNPSAEYIVLLVNSSHGIIHFQPVFTCDANLYLPSSTSTHRSYGHSVRRSIHSLVEAFAGASS